MNNDLISREALLERLKIYPYRHERSIDMRIVEKAPAVDAVEVVRCRDCRYWRHESLNHLHWVCTQHSNEKRTFYTLPTFFCADGLRCKE